MTSNNKEKKSPVSPQQNEKSSPVEKKVKEGKYEDKDEKVEKHRTIDIQKPNVNKK
jgi:hypothetical protein